MKDVIEDLVGEYGELYNKATRDFLQRIYTTDISVYSTRLKALGFDGRQRVLDAGCGFGQWTLALSCMCEYVHAVDESTERLLFLRELVNRTEAQNIAVENSCLTILNYPDNFFDCIFTYNVLTMVPWREVTKEFYRVLKPGGFLYANASSIGWQLHLWHTAHNAIDGYDPRRLVGQAFHKTLDYERGLPLQNTADLIIPPEDIVTHLQLEGFENVLWGAEGTLTLPDYNGPAPKRFYEGEYFGNTGIYDVLAQKN